MADSQTPFWELKTLAEMSVNEWESLCDGCAKCCLHKLQDEDTNEIFYTSVACEKLDINICRCSVYEQRLSYVPDCLDLAQENLDELSWLPNSCAYRIVAEGRSLPEWHHLISGDINRVHKAGMSVAGRVVSETEVPPEELELYIIEEFKTEN